MIKVGLFENAIKLLIEVGLFVEACTLGYVLSKSGLLRTSHGFLDILRSEERPWISGPEQSNSDML
jgi:hypothetical protein